MARHPELEDDLPLCEYCHEARPGTRARRIPCSPEEDGIWLCPDCWRDILAAPGERRWWTVTPEEERA